MVGLSFATAQTTVPNEFSSGLPAKAQEVNENFDVSLLLMNIGRDIPTDTIPTGDMREEFLPVFADDGKSMGERGLTVNMAMARLVNEI